jgi:hypothetical protein
MKEYAITPDLGATEEVNVVEAILESTKRSAAAILEALAANPPEDKEEADGAVKIAQAGLDAAEKALEEFKPADDQPTVTVGYIHPRKMSSIDNQRYIALRGQWKPQTATLEQLDSLTEIAREIVRFGVKGHKNFGFDFMQEKANLGSAEVLVVPDVLLDFYQATKVLGLGILHVLADKVQEFNALSEKKSTPSLSHVGTDPVNSTAPSVTTTYESGEDAKSQPINT